MKLFTLLLITSLFSQVAFADCDFTKDIITNPDGTRTYSKECHVEVGKRLTAAKDREAEVDKLNKAVELQDIALDKAHERIDKWQDTSKKLEDQIDTIQRTNDTTKVLYFVVGVLLTGLAVWGAGHLAGH